MKSCSCFGQPPLASLQHLGADFSRMIWFVLSQLSSTAGKQCPEGPSLYYFGFLDSSANVDMHMSLRQAMSSHEETLTRYVVTSLHSESHSGCFQLSG